ncbi:hypothetical protein ACFTZG_11340 [Streptomyces albidoflavus]
MTTSLRPPPTPSATWNPEDPVFWAATGARTARRNLVWSVFSQHNVG